MVTNKKTGTAKKASGSGILTAIQFKVRFLNLFDNLTCFPAEVWPGPTYFPDFTDLENTGKWWTHECDVLHNETGITYDALWIDMNEPANFQTDSGALTVSSCFQNQRLISHPCVTA